MDDYTASVRDWLDRRFRMADEDGIYIPHQPVYGVDPTKGDVMTLFNELCVTYSILMALTRFTGHFGNMIDVGCAEGYTSHSVMNLLPIGRGIKAIGFDLSHEAVTRARELYQLPATAGDISELPFADSSFDLVVCSEVVEHVVAPQVVLAELDRITRGVLLLTTPADWNAPSDIFRQPDTRHLHDHINQFSVSGLKEILGHDIIVWGARSVFPKFNGLQQELISRRIISSPFLKTLVWLNYTLAWLAPRHTLHYVVFKVKQGDSDRIFARMDTRFCLQARVLTALFERNSVPKMRIGHASNA